MVVARPSSRHLPSIWKRLSSTTTFTAKAIPSKSHLHQPIPDSHFPKGYALTGLHCGVKKDPSAPDLAVLLSTSPNSTASAVCTTINAFKAAPVLVTKDVQEKTAGRARALVVNSGCANAVTGTKGMEDAWAMMRATDALLDHPQSRESSSEQPGETLVMSTGVIGQLLPISKILAGINASRSTLGSAFSSWELFARGFMTTDTFPKLRARTFSIKGREYRMAGVDKGAGMIHPNMGPVGPPHATLLGCIVTDAPVSPSSLSKALTYAVERSFNSISVDGDMSTNDTIVAFANGAAVEKGDVAAVEIDEAKDEEAYIGFRDELTGFAQDLAKLVVRDGEGATKFVTVSVEVCLPPLPSVEEILFTQRRRFLQGAATYSDAHKIASRISTSALVKTALYGEDAK